MRSVICERCLCDIIISKKVREVRSDMSERCLWDIQRYVVRLMQTMQSGRPTTIFNANNAIGETKDHCQNQTKVDSPLAFMAVSKRKMYFDLLVGVSIISKEKL